MIIKDAIHGSISLPKHIQDIVQTKQFQRLKDIKQTGLLYLKVPQAIVTRYDHCIGTYFLANKAIDALEKNSKGLVIPDFYRKAVTIAALLHDIGHGPFSHTWELICQEKYHHEEGSKDCIDQIFENLPANWTDDLSYALDLIKSLIVGDSSCLRDKNFLFLYEIVNNKQCSVDVDKWDYLKRDYLHFKDTLPDVNMDFDDVFEGARASSDRCHIEYRFCDFQKIYNIFDARATFHIAFYQMPHACCLDNLLHHIISENESNLQIIDGIKIRDIRSKDKDAFLKLTDKEIWRILKSLDGPNEAVSLVKCLENASITEIFPTKDEEKNVPEYLKTFVRIPYAGTFLRSEDIHFYGDLTDKPQIVQKQGYYESKSYFQITI